MEITTTAQLQQQIEYLHSKSDNQKESIRIHFKELIESMKPVNLLKSTVKDIGESPGLAKAAIGTSVAIGAGVLSKKMIIGKSNNIFKRVLGTVVEFAVARSIANNSEAIASKGISLLKKMAK